MATSGKDGKSTGNDKNTTERHGGAFDMLLRGLQELTTQTWSKQPGNLLDLLMRTPDAMVQMGRAGKYLKDLREVAGLTIDDLAGALHLDSPDLLSAIEEGRSPVNLDMLYRLASFHARNDPMGFVFDYSREYAPLQWQLLRLTGMDKLLISAERELKFINLYRARDRARALDDGEFEQVVAFLGQALDLALDFNDKPLPPRAAPTDRKGRAAKKRPARE
ncbi:MAG: helix-turn-helix transcriptional regulator [Porticoccaceae bacterium]